jgi:hypothetical protein
VSIRALAAAGLALAALAAGCGGDSEGSPIPAEQASELQRQLDSVAGRIRDGSVGACLDAIQDSPRGDNVTTVNGIIDSLPGRVDQDVRDALQRSFDRLFDLVSQRCDELQQTDKTTTETTETTPTDTTPTDTTPTDTTPTDTTPTDTTPTTPEVPTLPTVPDQGGQGDGSGSGGAGAPGQGL